MLTTDVVIAKLHYLTFDPTLGVNERGGGFFLTLSTEIWLRTYEMDGCTDDAKTIYLFVGG